MEKLDPITREEIFMAEAAGDSVPSLTPITRKEYFLKRIAENAGSGTGGGTGGSAFNDIVAAVGQTFRIKSVDENGKVTAVEAADYQPRTHWSEIADILTETTLELIPDMGFMLNSALPLTGGQEYTVIFNGTEYVLECIDMGGMFFLGVQIDTNENGETICIPIDGVPFIAMTGLYPGLGDVTVVTPEDTELTSITFGVKGEQVHKIPDKYIPEGVQALAPHYIAVYEVQEDDGNKVYNALASVTQIEEMIAAGRQVIAKVNMQISNSGTLYMGMSNYQSGDYGGTVGFCNGIYALALIPQEDDSYLCTLSTL